MLTKAQTNLIIKLSERYGIGVAFSASRAGTTVTKCEELKRAGYLATVAMISTYGYRLTEKAQEVINENN